MIAARKIHDEINLFEGILKNKIFLGLWLVIIAGQVIICQFGSIVFVVSPDGLDGVQWGMCIAIGFTGIIVNLILKFIPDWFCFKLGMDSVDDRRKEKAAAARA